MTKKKRNKQPILTTTKMPGETEQQYTAWFLYLQAGSLEKTLSLWDRVGVNRGEIGVEIASKLGKKPSHSTLDIWSGKFRWVERRDLKLAEELEALKKKATDIRNKKRYAVTEAFWDKLEDLKKQMRKGEHATVAEVKALWEMMRTEWGESTSKTEVRHTIDEEEQKPPDPEEDKLGKEIDEVIKRHYAKRKQG